VEVHHAALHHWSRTVWAGLGAAIGSCGPESRDHRTQLFGGTCVNTGCTPTKTLAASAYIAHAARRAGDYGVRIEGSVNVDMKPVKARKDAVVAVFHNGGAYCAARSGHPLYQLLPD
jgi:pyruvate/2-oxoglutarate dehydrogenase complex dihydrolipoamide dehydrogenase (E3) component